MTRLQDQFALTGETHDQPFAGEQRLFEPAHAANGV